MINTFFLVGEIKKLDINTSKDPAKGESARILVQYGPDRDQSKNQVEFVNAVIIRIPNFKFPALKAKLAVGKQVQVNGHLQGVLKSVMDDGFFTTELVADRVFIVGEERGNKPETAAAE